MSTLSPNDRSSSNTGGSVFLKLGRHDVGGNGVHQPFSIIDPTRIEGNSVYRIASMLNIITKSLHRAIAKRAIILRTYLGPNNRGRIFAYFSHVA